MTTKTYTVFVSQVVEVTLDATKFDDAFLAKFGEDFYTFDTVERHAEHLAQLFARGLIDEFGEQFIEGYGPARNMGISFRQKEGDQEIVEIKS